MTITRDKQGEKGAAKSPSDSIKRARIVIKGWKDITQRLKNKNPDLLEEEYTFSIDDLPKLMNKIKPKYYYRYMECMELYGRDVFYCIGLSNKVTTWTVRNNGRDVEQETLCFPCPLISLTHVMNNKVFVGLKPDKTMSVIKVIRGLPKEVCPLEQIVKALCFITIQETNQFVVGGVGFVKSFSMAGIMKTPPEVLGFDVSASVGKEEWITGLEVNRANRALLILAESGVIIVDYIKWKELFQIRDPSGKISCCTVFGYTVLVTGNRMGGVKVWSTAIKVLMHEFVGHQDHITAVSCHRKEPLLISSSADGWIFIWRLDTFRQFKQVFVGDSIRQLHVSAHPDPESVGFWCELEKGVVQFYETGEPYRTFACMDSTVVKLKRLLGHDEYPNRILIGTGDGGVWFKNPVTSETVGCMFPIIAINTLEHYVYDVFRQRLYTILPEGVLKLSCSRSPFRALELLTPESPDEDVMSITSMLVGVGTDQYCFETVVIFIGLRNGQIELLESECFHMAHTLKAHHGSVDFLETLAEVMPGEEQLCYTRRILVSAGSDLFIRLWELQLLARDGIQFEMQLIQVVATRIEQNLKHVICSVDIIAVTYAAKTTLHMFNIGRMEHGLLRSEAVQQLECLKHPSDSDHTDTITGLDKCPLLRIFATSSMDKTVKIWNDQNSLIRELVFEEPVVDICFVTDIGDLLIARDFVLVFSSPDKYLPWSYLEEMLPKKYKEEVVEHPKEIKESERSWVDPKRVPARKRTTPRPTRDASLVYEEWQLTWKRTAGGETRVTVPVKFRPSRQRARQGKSRAELVSSASQAASCSGRGPRLRIDHEKLASHRHDRKRVSVGSNHELQWLPAPTRPSTSVRLEGGAETERPETGEKSLRQTPGKGEGVVLSVDSKSEALDSSLLVPSAFPSSWLPASDNNLVGLKVRPAEAPTKPLEESSPEQQNMFPPLQIPGPGELPPYDEMDVSVSVEDMRMTGEPMRMPPARALAEILKIAKSKALKFKILRGDEKLGRPEASHYPARVFPPSEPPKDPTAQISALSASSASASASCKVSRVNQQDGKEVGLHVPSEVPFGLRICRSLTRSNTDKTSTTLTSWEQSSTPAEGSTDLLSLHTMGNSISSKSKPASIAGKSFRRTSRRFSWYSSKHQASSSSGSWVRFGLTESETQHLLDKSIRLYIQQPGCGPVGPLMKRQVSTPQPVERKISYVDLEQRKWHLRCMHVPELPNSVISRVKPLHPPPARTLSQRFRDRIKKLTSNLMADDRPPIFKKAPRPPKEEEEEEEEPVSPPVVIRKAKTDKSKRKKKEAFIQWETLEEFAPIRREKLPVFSTRLLPGTLFLGTGHGEETSGSKSQVLSRLSPELKQTGPGGALGETRDSRATVVKQLRRKGHRRRRSPADSRNMSDSSTDVVMHVEMIHCYYESWFPKNIPRKPEPIFKALLSLLTPDTQVDVLLQVLDYVGILIREARLSPELKEEAGEKVLALLSHPSAQVRAAVVALLPEFKGLTRALLRELYQLLKTGDDDMQTSVARTLQRYHINTKHDFIDALEEHNLLRTPARAKTERYTVRRAVDRLKDRLGQDEKARETMAYYESLFCQSDGPYWHTADTRMPEGAVPVTSATPGSKSTSTPSSGRSEQRSNGPAIRLAGAYRSRSPGRKRASTRRKSLAEEELDETQTSPRKRHSQSRRRSSVDRGRRSSVTRRRPPLEYDIEEWLSSVDAGKHAGKDRGVGTRSTEERRSAKEGTTTPPARTREETEEPSGRGVGTRSAEGRRSAKERTTTPPARTREETEEPSGRGVGTRSAEGRRSAKEGTTTPPARTREETEEPDSWTSTRNESVVQRSAEERISSGKSEAERRTSGKSPEEGRDSGRLQQSPSGERYGERKRSRSPSSSSRGLPTSLMSAARRRSSSIRGRSPPGTKQPQAVVASDSRSSLHFISTDEDDGSDGALSDSSFQYDLPPRAKPESSSSKPRPLMSRDAKERTAVKSGLKTTGAKKRQTKTSKGEGRIVRDDRTPGCYWVPGEPGLRVHHKTVADSCSPRGPPPSESSRIQPLDGRLGVFTASRQSGQCQYGTLRMDWTTRVPMLPVRGMAETLQQIDKHVLRHGGLRTFLANNQLLPQSAQAGAPAEPLGLLPSAIATVYRRKLSFRAERNVNCRYFLSKNKTQPIVHLLR